MDAEQESNMNGSVPILNSPGQAGMNGGEVQPHLDDLSRTDSNDIGSGSLDVPGRVNQDHLRRELLENMAQVRQSQSTHGNLRPGQFDPPSRASTGLSSILSRQQTTTTLQHMKPEVRENWTRVIAAINKQQRIAKIRTMMWAYHGRPCEVCNSMELSEEKFLIDEVDKHVRPQRTRTESKGKRFDFGPNKFPLGSLKEIYDKHKTCPFCKLIVSTVEDMTKTGLLFNINVTPKEDQPTSDQLFERHDLTLTASWQIDGRLLKRDDQQNIIGQRACTRRIRLQWSDKTLRSIHVVLLNPRRESKGLFLARPDVRVDAAVIRNWVELCHEQHGKICQGISNRRLLPESYFGVVDVEEMCLTGLPRGERYVALSYMWGTNPHSFTTKKSNIKGLLTPGGLRKHESNLPRTIKDSIALVKALGERYLWVDALCIIQDSKRSWALNSRLMNLVYGNAYFSICAADGDYAGAGLKALQPHQSGPGTHLPEQIIVRFSPEMRLTSTVPAEKYIENSAWSKRGWTFQERLLSPRNVIFTHGRVFFQCRCTCRSIDIVTEDASAGWSLEFSDSPVQWLQQLNSQPLLVYKKALELYLERELSLPRDILAAFSGIGHVICESLGGSLVFGLPSSHFDWALLWEPQNAANRRKEEADEFFPSWSWCGWKGDIMQYKQEMVEGCEDNMHEWLMHHTWITWYIRVGNGNLRIVWDSETEAKSTSTSPLNSIWRGYSGLVPGAKKSEFDRYGRYIKEEERHLPRDTFSHVLEECPYGVTVMPPGASIASTMSNTNIPDEDQTYLQFWTWSAYFRIRPDEHKKQDTKSGFLRYSIEDYKEDMCGTIMLDRYWVKHNGTESPLEFIAISDAKSFSKSEYDDWSNYIPMERPHAAWELYYVMLIETDSETGISSRVGLGKVFKDAFENSCEREKLWKEFILG